MEPRSDPDRQIADARASLVEHLGELGRRLKVARARFDIPAQIAAHPLVAVGAAFALGALLGLRGGGDPSEHEPGEGGLGRAVMAGLAALAVRAAKELAMRGATEAARSWWEHSQQSSSSETRTSYDSHMEPFLRH
jgi:hypothetical protein